MRGMTCARSLALIAAVLLCACIPRLSPLKGDVAPAATLPRNGVLPGHHQVVFNWELEDRDMTGRGEGVARIASPDSARMDFFLAGGFGGGGAVLIGDSVRTPPGAAGLIRRLVPPPTLLWATLGRVALPNLADTVIRVEGATLRADIGNPVAWRLTFRSDTLVRAERVEGGRVAEWVDRSDPAHVRYRDESGRRSLQLTITRTNEVPEFDASIWRFDR
jgi:hypothetical protein